MGLQTLGPDEGARDNGQAAPGRGPAVHRPSAGPGQPSLLCGLDPKGRSPRGNWAGQDQLAAGALVLALCEWKSGGGDTAFLAGSPEEAFVITT